MANAKPEALRRQAALIDSAVRTLEAEAAASRR